MIDLVEKGLANRHIRFAPKFRQFRRKNNDIVKAMYAMYLTGKSIEDVAKVYRKTRQAAYDQFKARGFKLRSKQMKGLQVLDGIKFTLMKSGYLRGSVPGRGRMTMHKYLWEKHRGEVPPGHNLHFKDGNRENVSLENLECLPIAEINRRFNPHHNQATPIENVRRPERSVRLGTRKSASKKPKWLINP